MRLQMMADASSSGIPLNVRKLHRWQCATYGEASRCSQVCGQCLYIPKYEEHSKGVPAHTAYRLGVPARQLLARFLLSEDG